MEAGLADQIRTTAFLAYLSKPSVVANPDQQAILKIPAIQRAIAENKNQVDLFYMSDILVTAGVVNGNDDLFLPEEVYSARHTPEDKPFNLGHENTDIIGHITSQHLIDDKNNIIADDITVDDLPFKFHVVNNTVIYRYWSDAERLKKISQIIAEIETANPPKWFVSMEAIFSGFDYGMMSDKGELEITPRDKTTAFLTKYLCAYGGPGKYENRRIVRVLRDFVFSGKGLVETPANPESIIYAKAENFFIKNPQLSNGSGYVLNSKHDKENGSMNELDTLKAQLTQAQVTLAGEIAARTEVEKQLKEINEKQYQGKLDTLAAQVKAFENKQTELLNEAKANKDQLEKLTQDKANLEVSLKEANQKLADTEKDKVKAGRITEIKTKLGLDDVQADALYETVAEISDEKFAKFVAAAPKTVANTEKKEQPSKEALEALENAKADQGKIPASVETEQKGKFDSAIAAVRKTFANRRHNKETVTK